MNIMKRFVAIFVLSCASCVVFANDDETRVPFGIENEGLSLVPAEKGSLADVSVNHDADPLEGLDDLFVRAKEHKIKSNDENLSPRKFLLKSKAEDNNIQAVLYRNVPDPVDEVLVTEKQLYNIDKSRESGERMMNKKNINVSAETSLSASFNGHPNGKKKSIYLEEKPKDYRAEAIKHREAANLKKQQQEVYDDNGLYRDKAGSLSASFE